MCPFWAHATFKCPKIMTGYVLLFRVGLASRYKHGFLHSCVRSWQERGTQANSLPRYKRN